MSVGLGGLVLSFCAGMFVGFALVLVIAAVMGPDV